MIKNWTNKGDKTWVHFIKVKRWRFKRQNMAFKCQKWHLAFSKFHKIILAFKTPKCDMLIINIGVYNTKKRGVLNAKIGV